MGVRGRVEGEYECGLGLHLGGGGMVLKRSSVYHNAGRKGRDTLTSCVWTTGLSSPSLSSPLPDTNPPSLSLSHVQLPSSSISHLCYGLQCHGCARHLHYNLVEDGGTGPSGANGVEGVTERCDALLHAIFLGCMQE